MSLSARRRRRRIRLGLIFGVIALIAGGIGVRYAVVSQSPADTASDPRREAGLAAFSAGDDAQVIAQLRPYLEEGADDTEARFALASTQLKQADDNPAVLMEAVMGLRRVLRDQPDHAAAAELILPVLTDYPRGVEEEGLRIADRVLRKDAEHVVAMRAKAVLLSTTGRNQEALAAAQAYLKRQPADVKVHRLTLDLMKRTNQPSTALVDYAQTLQASDPQQPAFDLVEAYALLITDDREAAAEVLKVSAEQSPPDTTFVREQIVLMDGAVLFGEVLTYLEKLHAEYHDALPLDELIRRRFEAGRGLDALALIETLDDPTATQQALRALVLLGQQRADEAQAVIKTFETAQGRANRSIAGLLNAAAQADPQGLDAVIDAGREAKDAGVINPYLDLVVAEAFEQTGQPDRAITRYQSALRQRPSWAAPCLGLAELYLKQDNASEAMGYAVAAVQRQPQGVAGRILLAEAFADEPAKLSDTNKQEVLTLIDQVQQAQPGEPRTMALNIAVLAGTGDRAAATQAMRSALAIDPPLSQSAMVALIEAAKRYNLDPDGETQAAYVERFGQTLAITMVQAQRLVEAGDADAALALFDNAQPQTPSAEWDVNRALLLERIGHPDATTAWSAAGQTYANNLQVQQAQLDSAAAWEDRSAINDAIQRLRALTGEDDPRWRIEQARWWLASADPVAAAENADELLDAALRIEPDSAEALSLRGRAQRLLGNPRLAISLLSQAITLTPNNADARAELALAQRDSGSTEAALETARGAAAMDHASPNAQRRAAQLMIDQGEYTAAANVLARMYNAEQADTRDVFTLAQLYRQTRQTERALALIESMLVSPSPASIALAADLYAQAGMPEQAAEALGKLDDLELTDAEKLRIRAVHQSAYGDVAAGDAAWVALLNAAPGDTEACRQLVAYRLRSSQTEEAVAAAREWVSASSDLGLAAVVKNATLLKRLADEPGATALALALLEDPKNRDQAAEALAALERAKTNNLSADVLADRLIALAEASPDFESLWLLSVSQEFQAGRTASALARAEAARERFPDSPRSAQLLAEAYGVASRWRETLIAAEAWKSLSTGSRLEADTLAARAHRELGRAGASATLLAPYADTVRAEPLARPNLTKELMLAWTATGRSDAAREVLEPLLDQDERWRQTWLDAAVLSLSSTREAGRWLDTLDAVIPAEAWGERAALAQAWWAVGMRDSYAPFREKGRAMGETLTPNPGASGELWFFVGSAAEVDGDFAEADKAYRRALEIDPGLAGASNNLAMLIADHGGDLAEAVELARRTIAAVPNEPNYHDTLAYVLKRAGRTDEAREAIERAIELDPGNPAWRMRLNEMAIVE